MNILKRSWWVTSDVYKAIRPTYSLTKYLCLFPYNLENRRLQRFCCLFTFLHCVCILGVIFLCLSNLPWPNIPIIHIMLHKCQLFSMLTYGLIAIGTAFRTRNTLAGLYSELNLVDKSLSGIGTVFKYDLTWDVLITGLRFILLILFIVYYMLDAHEHNPYAFGGKSMVFTYCLMFHALQRHFTTLVWILKDHFRFLSEKLKVLNESSPYIGRIWKMECLVQVHDSLCSVADEANAIFAIQNLACVVCTFTFLTGNCYVIANSILGPEKILTSSYIIDLLVFTLFWSFELWDTVYQSKKSTDESKQFTSYLFRILVDDESKELSTNMVLSLHVMMDRTVEFTAYDFFALDYTLFHSIIAATATYLIILVQFS